MPLLACVGTSWSGASLFIDVDLLVSEWIGFFATPVSGKESVLNVDCWRLVISADVTCYSAITGGGIVGGLTTDGWLAFLINSLSSASYCSRPV